MGLGVRRFKPCPPPPRTHTQTVNMLQGVPNYRGANPFRLALQVSTLVTALETKQRAVLGFVIRSSTIAQTREGRTKNQTKMRRERIPELPPEHVDDLTEDEVVKRRQGHHINALRKKNI